MNIRAAERLNASECMNDPWLLKKTDEPVDEGVANNALRTLRRFRVKISYFNILTGRSKVAAGCTNLHSVSTSL